MAGAPDRSRRSSDSVGHQLNVHELKSAMNDVPDAIPEEFDVEKVKKWAYELKDKPTNTPWFRNLVMGLVHSLVTQHQYLTNGYKRNSPSLLAWACRNLLELDVITRHCLRSPKNSRDFLDDMWIDAIEFLKSSREWLQQYTEPGGQTPAPDEFIARYEAKKKEQGITRERHLEVRELAKAVGMEVEYQTMNRMTSKLVHQTSFSLLAFEKGSALRLLMRHILDSGNTYAS